jgi:hypothetical protein
VLPPYPTDKPMQFLQCVFWDLAGVELAASGPHFLGSKPDTKVSKVDESDAVRPPYETELLDGEKNKPPYRFFCLRFQILSCAHIASLVWWQTKIGRPRSCEGSANFGTNLSREAHN